MATQQQSDNQASAKVIPGQGSTEVRLGNQASEYARRNGIPEITKTDTAAIERNQKDQTDVTKISATLPDGQNWTQNWLERMRGEARIKLPFSGTGMGSAQNASDEARDRYLEKYFSAMNASTPTMRQFMGQKKIARETPESDTSVPQVMIEEVAEDTSEEEEVPPIGYQPDPASQKKVEDEQSSKAQTEIIAGLSMGQVRKGLLAPAIATASVTGIASILALSSSDPEKTATLIRSITHLVA